MTDEELKHIEAVVDEWDESGVQTPIFHVDHARALIAEVKRLRGEETLKARIKRLLDRFDEIDRQNHEAVVAFCETIK